MSVIGLGAHGDWRGHVLFVPGPLWRNGGVDHGRGRFQGRGVRFLQPFGGDTRDIPQARGNEDRAEEDGQDEHRGKGHHPAQAPRESRECEDAPLLRQLLCRGGEER